MVAMKLSIEPRPDFSRLEKVLRRQGTPDRVPFYELFSNIVPDVLEAIGQGWEPADKNRNEPDFYEWRLRRRIAYMYALGYDYVTAGATNFGFPREEEPKAMTAHGERSYHTADMKTISGREDFATYPWPVMSNIDYSLVENAEGLLPDGMMIIGGSTGILENVTWLLGYAGLSYLVYDDPQLVRDMFEAVATRIIEYLDTVASIDAVGALCLGEDMGFKTQSFFSPDIMREYVFPWHKRLVDAVHRHEKPIILHACGNLSEIMEDIIDCGWDAKHSFQDNIEPVWETKAKYGGRIALLGGFDMDKISRMTEPDVRAHTRFLIEMCAPGGGWALGTGNSVAQYVPVRNFLAMLDEGFKAGTY